MMRELVSAGSISVVRGPVMLDSLDAVLEFEDAVGGAVEGTLFAISGSLVG